MNGGEQSSPVAKPGNGFGASDYLTIHLPLFDGPLDLLYYLIRKHELEISEISLASIADEFVNMVEAAKELNLSAAGGYLVIAATLMHLKSKWLLPPEEEPQGSEEQEAQVGELLQQLTDLSKLRELVHELGLHEDRTRATFPRPLTSELEKRLERMAEKEPFIEMTLFELLKAMRRVQEFAFPRTRDIVREEINLEDKIIELIAIIKIRVRVNLSLLMGSSRSVLEAVVFFLASLELARLKLLRLSQKDSYGEIEATARTDSPSPAPPPAPAEGS